MSLKPEQVAHVQRTWKMIPQTDYMAVGTLFYDTMFEMDPNDGEIKRLFEGISMVARALQLMQMFNMAVDMLSKPSDAYEVLFELGLRHAGYGVLNQMYDAAGPALLATLDKGLGAEFTEDVKEAWTAVWGLITTAMKAGADSERGQERRAAYVTRLEAKKAKAAAAAAAKEEAA